MKEILLLLVLFLSFGVDAAHVEIAPHLRVDIPAQFREVDSINNLRVWESEREYLYISVALDTIEYDYEKCFEHYHEIVLSLDKFACFERNTEPFLDWHHDYIERSYYHINSRFRARIHTAYAGGVPYVIGYVYPPDGDDAPFREVVDSLVYNGSWWFRLKRLFSQSVGLILFLPMLIIFIAGVLEIFVSKKYLVAGIALIFAVWGLPLWSEWDTAIVVYAIWGIILTLFAILDYRDFNEFVSKVDSSIP